MMEPSVVANEHIGWQSVDSFPKLTEGEVQVWRAELKNMPACPGLSQAYLSSQEKARASRRIAGRAREEFVAGRTCLRILLGQVFGIEPLLVPLTENAFGKPESEFAGQRIFFNVTHTKGNVFIAMATQGPIGVDVEYIDPIVDVVEIASFAFTGDELERLLPLSPEDERRTAFYRCWTRKEAVAKADGRGLSLDLCKIPIPISAKQLGPMNVTVQDAESSKEYLLCDIPLGPSVVQSLVGALAIESLNPVVSWLEFPPSFLEALAE